MDFGTLERPAYTAKRLIRELRKWNLAPLGAVLVVVILCAGAFAFVVTAHDNPTDFEGMIRSYFATKPGSRVPPDRIRMIEVPRCIPYAYSGKTIYKCSISFEDQGFVECFTFDHDRVTSSFADRKLGCDLVGWDPSSKSLVVL